MDIFTMLSAAALAAAQPAAASDRFVGPVLEHRPIVSRAVAIESPGDDAGLYRIALDLPVLAQGAQLRLRIMKLKLKVPI